MNRYLPRRLSGLGGEVMPAALVRGAVGALILLSNFVAAPALALGQPAEAPDGLAGRVTDTVGVIEPDARAVEAAIARLADQTPIGLYVVFIRSFDGMSGGEWVNQAHAASSLGLDDVVLAVAVEDGLYAYTSDEKGVVERDTLVDLVENTSVPLMNDGEWSRAAIALADGLRASHSGEASGFPTGLVAVGAAVAILGTVLIRRERRGVRAGGPQPAAARASGPTPDPDGVASHPSRQQNDALSAIREMQTVVERAAAGDAAAAARAEGFAATMAGDNVTALERAEGAARLGNVGAMYDAGCANQELGRMADAERWWKAAAQGGHVGATYNLGVLAAQNGNLEEAKQWFERAGARGDPGGYAALSQIAAQAGDLSDEMHWAALGAEAGHAWCLMRYGQLIAVRSPENPVELQRALPFIQKAAELGEVEAMFLAGIVNAKLGETHRARSWFSRAEAGGHPRARALLNQLS